MSRDSMTSWRRSPSPWLVPMRSMRSVPAVMPAATVLTRSADASETPIDVYDFIDHEGARLVSYLSYAHPQPPGPDLQYLVDLVTANRLHPTLGLVDDWSNLTDILSALAHRRLSGKAVLTIG
jgi:NADPH2:quinone reductase